MSNILQKTIENKKDNLINTLANTISDLNTLINEVSKLNIDMSQFISIPTTQKDIILDNLTNIEKMIKKSIYGRGYNAE